VVLQIGPVEVTSTVVYSLIASLVLIGLALLVRRGLGRRASGWPVAAEYLVEHFEDLMRDMFGRDSRPFTPLVVTLALYIATANLLGLVPGLRSPTADISATAALAVLVFFAVPVYGIRARGVRGYLKHYLEPTPWLLPFEIITELSRTLALAVRLFGNVMSEELVIAVLLSLAGLLVPVPMMLLAVLTSLVQAYIFAVLTVVYLSAAVRAQPPERSP
jgi:F-type H+-transporting ATPase subunit a